MTMLNRMEEAAAPTDFVGRVFKDRNTVRLTCRAVWPAYNDSYREGPTPWMAAIEEMDNGLTPAEATEFGYLHWNLTLIHLDRRPVIMVTAQVVNSCDGVSVMTARHDSERDICGYLQEHRDCNTRHLWTLYNPLAQQTEEFTDIREFVKARIVQTETGAPDYRAAERAQEWYDNQEMCLDPMNMWSVY